jgi:hypothetical protein
MFSILPPIAQTTIRQDLVYSGSLSFGAISDNKRVGINSLSLQAVSG